jgi:hypothetical protein
LLAFTAIEINHEASKKPTIVFMLKNRSPRVISLQEVGNRRIAICQFTERRAWASVTCRFPFVGGGKRFSITTS